MMNNLEKKTIDVLFIIPPYHKRNGSGLLFPLGISYIIAYLEQRGITYDYIDCTQIIDTLKDEDLLLLENRLTFRLEQYSPQLVGIGPCVTPGAKGLEVVARQCIARFGVDIVFAGGPFTMLPSQEWFFYEQLGIKYLIKGDGEKAVFAAIEAVKKGEKLSECSCISYHGKSVINIIEHLDELPFPKRIQMERYVFSDRRRLNRDGMTAHIITSRGCPYKCHYCVSGNLKIKFRKRSVQNIVLEMKYLSDSYGVTDIVFYDDCFFISAGTVQNEIRDFCSALDESRLNITWQIEIRPDIIMAIPDKELIMLSEHGCRQMNIGIEKASFDGASVFGKKFDYAELKKCLAHVHEICNIQLAGTFILGGKNETVESVKKMIYASSAMNLDKAEYSPLFVYPDTPVYSEVFSDPKAWYNMILHSEEPWGEVLYENVHLTKRELINLVNEAYSIFYQNKNTESKKVNDRYNLKG